VPRYGRMVTSRGKQEIEGILMAEPYKAKKIPDHWKTSPKTQVKGKLVAISGLRLEGRGTWLMHPRTRACPKNAILELTVTDEEGIEPGLQVNSVTYIGFMEVTTGGIVVTGDTFTIDGKDIGIVAGFSDIHCPNHLNIMITCNKKFVDEYIEKSTDGTITKLNFQLYDEVVFGKKF